MRWKFNKVLNYIASGLMGLIIGLYFYTAITVFKAQATVFNDFATITDVLGFIFNTLKWESKTIKYPTTSQRIAIIDNKNNAKLTVALALPDNPNIAYSPAIITKRTEIVTNGIQETMKRFSFLIRISLATSYAMINIDITKYMAALP